MAIENVPALVAVPQFPALADRALGLYNSKAYTFGDFMYTTFNGQMLAVANNVKNNAQEAYNNAVLAQTSGDLVVQAQSAANFKGNWSALSGALNMPASVAYANDFWALNTNTSNVASDVPGVSSKWTRLRTGTGGATEYSGVGILLTTAGSRVQSIATTAVDQTVTLPAAYTITTGGEIFLIENTGLFQYVVRDNVGGFLIALDPGQGAMFYLRNNSTQGGSWSVRLTEGSLSHTIYQAAGVTLNAASSNAPTITTLASGLSLVVYRVSSNLWAVPLSISGATITPGVALDLGAVMGTDFPAVVQMSSTTAIVVYPAITTGYATARHLTVSGSGAGATISPGTALTVNAAAVSAPVICSLSATTAVIAYSTVTGTNLFARTLSVTGGTNLTPNTEQSIRPSTAGQGQSISTLWGSQAILVSSGNTGGTIVQTLNISSGIVTPGTSLTLNAEVYWPSIIATSSTQALVSQIGGNGDVFNYRLLTIAGTDVTAGPTTGEHQATNTSNNPSGRSGLARLAVNRVMSYRITPGIGGPTSRNGRINMVGVNDNECVPGRGSVMKSSYSDFIDLAVVTTTKAIAVYTQASGFVQVRLLEIAA